MKCHICNQKCETVCADCNRPCCEDCRADFPHHDPPHSRCESCYLYRKGSKPPSQRLRRRDETYTDDDYRRDADWWKQ